MLRLSLCRKRTSFYSGRVFGDAGIAMLLIAGDFHGAGIAGAQASDGEKRSGRGTSEVEVTYLRSQMLIQSTVF